MRPRKWRIGIGLALAGALVIGSWSLVTADAGVAEVARTRQLTGRVVVNKTQRAGSSTQFKANDVVDVAAGGKLSVQFDDGSTLTLVGPARMAFVEMSESGRRVRLLSGVLTETTVGGVALEIQTPYAPSLVLQNASASARVVPGDRVTFRKLGGDYLKVYEGDKVTDLATTWSFSLRQAPAANAGTTRRASRAPTSVGTSGTIAQIVRGGMVITYRPAADVAVEERPGGVTRLTYEGGDFGRVDLGLDTVLFLGPGDYVEVDEAGNVLSFTGISHINHPIDDHSFYDEAADNAADISVSNPRAR